MDRREEGDNLKKRGIPLTEGKEKKEALCY